MPVQNACPTETVLLMLTRLLGCSLLMVAGSIQAGTVLELVNRDLTNKTESPAKTYAQDGRMRIETGGPQDSFAIFRDDTIYTFDPKQKSYVAMDRATIKQLADQLNPALKMLQEQMENMPPEQRAQMERMLGTKLPGTKEPVEEIRKTTRTATFAGHACAYSEILQDGVLQTEACVVPAASLKGSRELYDAATKVSALLEDMVDSIDLPMLKQMANRQMENFDRLGGVPVHTRTFDGGQAVHEATVKAIRNEALPATLFEIPAGYKKQELPNMTPASR
jgi:hypothetical protein